MGVLSSMKQLCYNQYMLIKILHCTHNYILILLEYINKYILM